MTSLTLPQVAATLAAALVGHEAVNKSGQRLIDRPMLNTALVLVIVTSMPGRSACLAASNADHARRRRIN